MRDAIITEMEELEISMRSISNKTISHARMHRRWLELNQKLKAQSETDLFETLGKPR